VEGADDQRNTAFRDTQKANNGLLLLLVKGRTRFLYLIKKANTIPRIRIMKRENVVAQRANLKAERANKLFPRTIREPSENHQNR